MGYTTIDTLSHGQEGEKGRSCPIYAAEYSLESTHIEPSNLKNSDSNWYFFQTKETVCGAFKISVWYKEPKINEQVIIMPNCSIVSA